MNTLFGLDHIGTLYVKTNPDKEETVFRSFRYRICCIYAVYAACYFFDYGAKFKETIFCGTHRAEGGQICLVSGIRCLSAAKSFVTFVELIDFGNIL
jgi:hypothetical protein